jgi:alcohol/geraniol dehydrogenase (NADP+)
MRMPAPPDLAILQSVPLLESAAMSAIEGFAALKAGAPLEPFAYTPGPLAADEVEVAVDYCGICHSDLSMIDSAWGRTRYPFIPGHEIIGRVVAAGDQVRGLTLGQRVGVGWFARSCMVCPSCTSADHHLCASNEPTIVGRHGGFASRVRCHFNWASALPDALDPASAGPLFCGGITVYSPLVEFGVRPTDRVAVVGIGGLGHLALKFLRAWGCEVTALTSTDGKRAEALALGAHHAHASNDLAALKALRGTFDFVLVTVNVTLDWVALVAALKPRGRLHFVGAVSEPLTLPVGALMGGQRSLSASPLGAPKTVAQMLDFCARHQIAPRCEFFPLAAVNDALDHVRANRARFRAVLKVA